MIFTLKVQIEKLKITSHIYLFQIHFVHHNNKYDDVKAALPYKDGLMVMGFFLEVTRIYVIA